MLDVDLDPDAETAPVVSIIPPTCQQRRLFEGKGPEALGNSSGISWSPDGSRLLQVRNARAVYTWTVADWRSSKLILHGNVTGMRAASWLPDGRILGVGEQDSDMCCLLTWTGSGDYLQTLPIASERNRRQWHFITAAVFSPDGATFFIAGISSSSERRAQFWNVSNFDRVGKLRDIDIQDIRLPSYSYCRAAFWSPDSRVLLSRTRKARLELWMADSPEGWRKKGSILPSDPAFVVAWMRSTPNLHELTISEIAGLCACKGIKMNGQDHSARDACSKVLVPKVGITAAEPCFRSPSFFFFGGGRGTVWQGQLLKIIFACCFMLAFIHHRGFFSPDGAFLALGLGDSCQVWQRTLHGWRWILRLHRTSAPLSLAWSPDSRSLAIGDASHTEVVGCSLAMPSLEAKTDPSFLPVTTMAWSHTGEFLAAKAAGAGVRLWTTDTSHNSMWQLRQNLTYMLHDKHDKTKEKIFDATAMAWSPVSNCLAIVPSPNIDLVQLWCQDDAIAGSPLKPKLELGHVDMSATGLDWSADGRRLAIVTITQELQLWSVGSSTTRDSVLNLNELAGTSIRVRAVAWSLNQDIAVAFHHGVSHSREVKSQQFRVLICQAEGATCVREDVQDVYDFQSEVVLAWSPDGYLATAEHIFWKSRKAWVSVESKRMAYEVQGLAWSPDGAFLAKFTRVQLAVWALRSDFSLQLASQAQGANVDMEFSALAWSSLRGGGVLSVATSVPTLAADKPRRGKHGRVRRARGRSQQLMVLQSENYRSLPSQLGIQDSDVCSQEHVTCKPRPEGRVDLHMKLRAGLVFWPLLPRGLAILPQGPVFFALVGLELDFTRVASESLPYMAQICEVLGLLPHLRNISMRGSQPDVWDCVSGLSPRLREFGIVDSRVAVTRRSLQVLLDIPELQSLDFSGTPVEVLEGKPGAGLRHIRLKGSNVEVIELPTEHPQDSWLGRSLGQLARFKQVQ